MTIGIICEYNPLHLGHQKQILAVRQAFGPDAVIVCAMSGNFVQRGQPAIIDKSIRAEAAILCGADLVVELPVTCALSSAEGFAAGGVRILSKLCDVLCFGAETGEKDTLMATAQALLSEEFPSILRSFLHQGLSFPAARERALTAMGLDGSLLANPNDILAVEYCKAILSTHSPMDIFPIRRGGSYHDQTADAENPSATAVRSLLLSGGDAKAYVPETGWTLFQNAPLHHISAGEAAILYRLRTMTDQEFEALPYGSEGLWRKLMHESRRANTLEEILTAVKSKRYTRTRLDRMVMCAFLGITSEDMMIAAPYARVLAFNDKGRACLSRTKKEGFFRNAGEETQESYEQIEHRTGDLYGLFCLDGIQAPGAESRRRIRYLP